MSEHSAELPPLLYEDLSVGRRFRPLRFVADEEVVARYVAIVGDENPLYQDPAAARDAGLPGAIVPPGLWGVWGRQAYLQDHTMPGGGVLAAEELIYVAPVAVGEELTVQAEVTEIFTRKERPNVVFEMTARTTGNEIRGIVRITAIWPT